MSREARSSVSVSFTVTTGLAESASRTCIVATSGPEDVHPAQGRHAPVGRSPGDGRSVHGDAH
jgi:hypothetical protein